MITNQDHKVHVMNTHKKFNKSVLASSVSLLLSSAAITPVIAQEQTAQEDVEVIQVSGIRGSLLRAMDIKRDSTGIVPALPQVV